MIKSRIYDLTKRFQYGNVINNNFIQQMNLILLFLFLILQLTKASNTTQTILLNESKCNFTISTNNPFQFLFCKIPKNGTLSSWSACLTACCRGMTQIDQQIPSYSALMKCSTGPQSSSKSSNNNQIVLIILSVTVSILALIIIVFLCGLAVKIFRILQGKNKTNQQNDETLPIQWQNEQQNLTLDISKPNWLSDIRSSQLLSENLCSICLQQNSNSVLFCKHMYHTQCIGLWLTKKGFCPLCHLQNIRAIKIFCNLCKQNYFVCRKRLLIQNINAPKNECTSCIRLNDVDQQIHPQMSQQFIYQQPSEANGQ